MGAVVARVAHPVVVGVGLVDVGHQRTVVVRLAQAVVVRIVAGLGVEVPEPLELPEVVEAVLIRVGENVLV